MSGTYNKMVGPGWWLVAGASIAVGRGGASANCVEVAAPVPAPPAPRVNPISLAVLQLCERCQQEILDLNDCTTPTWVRVLEAACAPPPPCAASHDMRAALPACLKSFRMH